MLKTFLSEITFPKFLPQPGFPPPPHHRTNPIPSIPRIGLERFGDTRKRNILRHFAAQKITEVRGWKKWRGGEQFRIFILSGVYGRRILSLWYVIWNLIADAHAIEAFVSQFVQRIYHIYIDNGRIPSRQFVIQCFGTVWQAHTPRATTVPRHQHQET